jgi:hypothetical protein
MVSSDYQHYITPSFISDAGTVNLKLEYTDMKDIAVFAKKADNAKALDQEKWNPMEVIRSKEVKVASSKGKHHRFLIVYEPKSAKATVRKPVIN